MRVLLVEDDDQLAQVLTIGLQNEAYTVDRASTMTGALDACRVTGYDVACVDLGLPDGDGLELVRRLPSSAEYRRPHRIIVITARDAVEQRVAGLDAGADDYLVKPFAFAELMARVRAVSRRQEQYGSTLRCADITLDTAAISVDRAGRSVDLTAREFSMLRYLMAHQNQVISAERLLEQLWDANADPFTASVRVLMSRIRRKLGDPSVIETVVNAGYRIGGNSTDDNT